MATLHSIYRYPLKGFNGQALPGVQLQVGHGVPFDRRFAISDGHKPVAAAVAGQWTACQAFVRLTQNAALSLFDLQFDETAMRLQLRAPDGERLVIDLRVPESLARGDSVLARWFAAGAPGVAMLQQAQAGYWDHVDAEIAVINAGTVDALSQMAGHPIDPLRFRGNLYLQGLAPQAEFALLNQRVRIGQAELEFIRPIDRCSATSLDPRTAKVDVNIPALLARHRGHISCGMYARVVKSGRVETGDSIEILGAARTMDAQRPPPSMAPEPQKWPRFARVLERVREDNHIDSFWLQDPLAAQRAPVQAGQHIRVHMQEAGVSCWRAYTVSAVQGERLRISVKQAQRSQGGSAWLHAHGQVGASLLMSGPFGEFTAPQQPRCPIVLVSAGVGLTPILAMLQDLARQKAVVPVHMLHSCHSVGNLALWTEAKKLLEQLAKAGAPTSVGLFVSHASAGDCLQFNARAGHLHVENLRGKDWSQAQAYLCGPTGFMHHAQSELLTLGMPQEHIHSEVFVSPKLDAGRISTPPLAGPFTVTFARQGLQAIWTPEKGSLLDLAESCGLKPSANCRSGACLTCTRTVLQGSIAHLLEPAMPQPGSHCLTCCAVPMSDLVLDL